MRACLRWLLIVAGLLAYMVLLAEIGAYIFVLVAWTQHGYESWMGEVFLNVLVRPDGWRCVLLPAAVATATQVMFLRAVLLPPHRRAVSGRSLKWSVLGAAFAASLLFVGMLLALGEAVHWAVTGETDIVDVINHSRVDFTMDQWGLWPYVLASWIICTPLLWVFTRRHPRNHLPERIAGWLLGGTIAEVIVVLPLDLMVRRKSDCYCATGTFWALVASGLALLWLAGPGIVLALTSKRRRLWFDTHCEMCGYAKGPTPGERCPECGYAWRKQTQNRS